MKTKEDTKMTATSANLAKPSKPKHHRKRKWLIIGIFMAVILIGVIVTIIIKAPWSPFGHIGRCNNKPATNAPRDIMACYLNDKYGKDFVLTGKIRRTPFGSSALWEHYYESDAHPVDDPRLRFKVKLDGDNKEHKFEKSDTYIEEGQILAEEDRLRPYIERIFGKDAEFGVEFRLCKIDGDTPKSFADLYRAMRICKERTAGMTRDQVVYSDDGLAHDYSLYIYDPDGQSIETDSDKTKIIERLREMAKYLPDGRLSAMSLRYYIKEGDRELEISASGLLASQSTSQLVYGFDKKVSKVIDTAKKCGPPPYPRERGWHLDKKERAKERTRKQSGCGNVSN